MKNRENFKHYPTPAELYALERAAREARAAEMGRLLHAGFGAVRGFLSRLQTRLQTKDLHHA